MRKAFFKKHNKRKNHFTDNENEVVINFLEKQEQPISADVAAHQLVPLLGGRFQLQSVQGQFTNCL